MVRLKAIFAGATQIIFGQGSVLAIGFVRNFMVARLVSPADFGTAATFAISVSLLQAFTDLAWDKLLIQAEDGDNPIFQSSMHLLTVMRGLITAALIFLLGGVLATYFCVPEATWAYRALAIVPLIRSLDHLDYKRVQRRLAYSVEAKLNIVSQAASLIIAICLAYWLRSYSAMLWALVAQALIFTVSSHVLSERSYSVSWSMNIVRRVFLFGWPLAVNGLIIISCGQGDRFLIGGALGMASLSVYTCVAMILTAMMQLAMNVIGNIALPLLAQTQDNEDDFYETYMLVGIAYCLTSVVMFVPFMFFGIDLVRFVFGDKYNPSQSLIAILSFWIGISLLRCWQITASLARGDTKNVLISNSVRLSGIILAYGVLQCGGTLVGVASAMAAGEILSTISASLRLNAYLKIPFWRFWRAIIVSLAVLFGFVLCSVLFFRQFNTAPVIDLGLGIGSGLLGVSALVFLCQDSRQMLAQLRRQYIE